MATLANPRYVPRHLTARELVIDFLSNRYPREMSVQEIAGVGIALGFSEQSLRMALTRLVEQSVAANTGRGRYRLSPSGEAMRQEVRKWRHLDDLAKPWSGAWIGVFDAAFRAAIAPRCAVTNARCGCGGFRELQTGLWVRPANLRDTVAELREHLRALGLHPAALVVGLNDLDEEARAKATSLWDTAAMLATYRALTDELLASKGKLRAPAAGNGRGRIDGAGPRRDSAYQSRSGAAGGADAAAGADRSGSDDVGLRSECAADMAAIHARARAAGMSGALGWRHRLQPVIFSGTCKSRLMVPRLHAAVRTCVVSPK